MKGDGRARLIAAFVTAGAAGIYALARMVHEPQWPTDFDQLWHAAGALREGIDPWSVIGPGKRFSWDWPLYYPLPAVLISLPFSWLPIELARVAFATCVAAVLGAAMGRRLTILWPVLLSGAFLMSAARTQWSPLVLAAAWVPWLSFLAIGKPTIAIASVAPHLTRKRELLLAVGAVVTALAISLVVRPAWFGSWWAATRTAPHIVAPILAFPGWFLALAALRWRRPEARLLLALACIPHTPSVYDLLPLAFICRSTREALVFALLTHAGFWMNILFGGGMTFEVYTARLGPILVATVYLPCLAAVLARPNVEESRHPVSEAGRGAPRAVSRIDVSLAGILVVAAFFFTWLPLTTTR